MTTHDGNTVTISPTSPVIEEGQTITYTATFSAGTSRVEILPNDQAFSSVPNKATITADYDFRINGQTYTGSPTQIFTASSNQIVFTLVAKQDGDAEGDESIVVVLSDDDTLDIVDIPFTIREPAPASHVRVSPGATVTEGTAAGFTLHANPAPSLDLPVRLFVRDAPGSDFVLRANSGWRTVVIPAGQSSVAFTVPTEADSTDEASGPVRVYIASGKGYYRTARGHLADTRVEDDDQTVVTLSVVDDRAVEKSGVAPADTATIEVSLNRVLRQGESLSVPISFVEGSGTVSPHHYRLEYSAPGVKVEDSITGNNRTVTLSFGANGNRSAKIVVRALDDGDLGDANDRVLVEMTANAYVAGGLDGGVGGARQVYITLADDIYHNGPPVFWIEALSSSVTEGSPAQFRVTTNRARTHDVHAPVFVIDAGDWSDFVDGGREQWHGVRIPAGDTSATYEVPTVDDNADEPDGRVTVRLDIAEDDQDRPTNLRKGPDRASVLVRDNDAPLVYTVPGVSVSAFRAQGAPGKPMWFCWDLKLEKDGAGNEVWPPEHPRRFLVGAEITSDVRGVVRSSGLGFGDHQLRRNPAPPLGDGLVKSNGFCLSVHDQPGEVLTARVKPGRSNLYYDGRRRVLAYRVVEPSSVDSSGHPRSGAPVTEPGGIALTIARNAPQVSEGGEVSFTISADTAPSDDLEVYVTAEERMGSGDDEIAIGRSEPLLLRAGQTSLTWTFTAHSDEVELDDGVIEARIDLHWQGLYKLGDPSTATMALIDDDGTGKTTDSVGTQQQTPAPVTVSIAAEQTSVAEENGETKWTIALSRALGAGETVTVPYTVSGGEPGAHWSVMFRSADNGPGVTRHGHGANGSELRFTEGGQVATLVLIGRPTTDTVERTIEVAFGTGGRAPSSTGIAAGIALGTSSFEVDIIDDDGTPQTATGVDPALVAKVRGYAAETHYGAEHVNRWKRVLVAFGVETYPGVTAMTVAEAQARADLGLTRWVPIPAAIQAVEDAKAQTSDGTQQPPPVIEPAVTVAAGASPVTEGGVAVFTITATPAPSAALAVTVAVAADGDYGVTAGSRTVTIPTGGSATLTLATTDDGTDEADGSTTATVQDGDGYTVGSPASGSVVIRDDDDPPVIVPAITIAAGTSPVTEGTDAVFTLTAAPAPQAPLAVTVAVAANGDYGVTGGDRTVTIPTGGSITLTLPTTDDATDEPDGSASVTVKAGNGYTVGSPASGSVVIRDDDLPPPVITIAAKVASITEGGDAVFTIAADRAPGSDLPVAIAVSETGGGDHVAAAHEGAVTATIRQGTTSAEVTVPTVNDTVDEPDGTVTATLKGGSGYTKGSAASASVKVVDDDASSLPMLSIDDTTVGEGTMARVTVRLSAPSEVPVRVHVGAREASPVSARAGEDFMAYVYRGWNALVFRPGQTARNVGFYVYDDSHDDGGETFEVFLSNAEGAAVADGTGIVTIRNDDPLPAAWLKRFGRTVAQQTLDGIAARIEAPRAAGMRGTLAGQALTFAPGDGDTAGPGDEVSGVPAAGGDAALAMAGIARSFGADASAPAGPGSAGPFGSGGTDPFGSGFGASQGQSLAMQSRTMTARDALLGSSFSLTGEKDGMGGSLAFWGRASQGRFDGTERGDGTDIRLDGTVTTGLLGADYARGKWLLGLALAQSSAEGDYAALGGSGCPEVGGEVPPLCDGGVRAGDGSIEASLTAAIPYAALQASERLKFWGATGHGSGEVTVKTAPGGRYSADTSWSMAAAGLRSDLLDAPVDGSGGPALAVTSDALWARTSSEKTRDLAASESDVTRLRLGLEGSWRMAFEGGGSLVPKLEAGARHDGGDAESGFGVELGGGIAWTDPALGLSLDLSGRTLLAHEDSDFEDRGYSASLAWDPAPATGRGPSLSLRQDWGGRATGGLDALFAPDPLAERAGDGANPASRWTMEAAYGLPAFGGRFTGSPHVGFGLSTGARDYSVGWRLTPEAATAPDLSFGIRATRRESDTQAPEHTMGFEVRATW